MIDRIVYDDDAHVLTVTFKATGSYRYFDVPKPIYDGLRRASSAGRFFNDRVRNLYRCEPERRRFRPAPG